MELEEAISQDLALVRENRPLVHSITNFVVMNETANAVLCIGALPIMSHAIEEVEEMVSAAGALVLNIGTLAPDWVDAMQVAAKRANGSGIPVILDPVGAGATRLRTDSARRLLENARISVVRCNAAEAAALVGVSSEIRGVESIGAAAAAEEVAGQVVAAYGCTVAVTGPVDYVTDGARSARISNGHAMMGMVVGTGCIADVIVAAFAAVQQDSFKAAVGGLAAFGVAGEIAAAASGPKPGTFHVELYNALCALDTDTLRERARINQL